MATLIHVGVVLFSILASDSKQGPAAAFAPRIVYPEQAVCQAQ